MEKTYWDSVKHFEMPHKEIAIDTQGSLMLPFVGVYWNEDGIHGAKI